MLSHVRRTRLSVTSIVMIAPLLSFNREDKVFFSRGYLVDEAEKKEGRDIPLWQSLYRLFHVSFEKKIDSGETGAVLE